MLTLCTRMSISKDLCVESESLMAAPVDTLAQVLRAVDWSAHIELFLGSRVEAERIVDCSLRLATLSKQFESADRGNPALSFIREMQVSSQYVVVLTALALYKPAASAMRCMLESALYYTYFRCHPSELATL